MSSVAQNTISKPKRGWVRKTGIIIIPILLLIGLSIGLGAVSVSYTHLTLPTIYSV